MPRIPGLLEYRQDQKKLYLRANKTWNLLTQEKEVIKELSYLSHTFSLYNNPLQGPQSILSIYHAVGLNKLLHGHSSDSSIRRKSKLNLTNIIYTG